MPTVFPAILLGVTISTLLAAVAHLLRGQNLRDLASIWLIAQAGFWPAQVLASLVRAPLWPIGELQWLAGLGGGVLALALTIVSRKRV